MDKIKTTGAVGLLVASIGSICCVAPVILAGLGVGAGALAFARSFGFLHMPLMILAIVLLAIAFYFHLRKTSSNSEKGCCETQASENKKTKIVLWVATGLTIILFLFPYLV